MQGMWVVDSAANLSKGQVPLEGVALLGSDRVLVVDVFASFGFERRHDSGNLLQQASVLGGMRTPRVLPFREMAKLHSENGCLDFIEATVPARFAAQIFFGLAVVAQRSNACGEFGHVGDDHARVTIRAQVFCGVEAEAGDIAE